MINPFACINDGLTSVTFVTDKKMNCLTGMAGFINDAKKYGGYQVYRNQSAYMRGKEIKINFCGRRGSKTRRPQQCIIDGEIITYERSLSWKTLHLQLEILVNVDKNFRRFESFCE